MADAFQAHDVSPPQGPPDGLDDESVNGGGGGGKRKRTPGGEGSRSKRSRYISIACNECKRRKIKCNGEVPCHRCGSLNLECIYAPNCCTSNFRDTTEFKQMSQHIMSLQEHIDSLWHVVQRLHGILGQEMPAPPQPRDPFAYDRAHNSAPQAPMLIDPALGARGGGKDATPPPPPPPPPPPHTSQHGQSAGARYTPAQQSNPSQLSYDLARASMESMGIASAEAAAAAAGREAGVDAAGDEGDARGEPDHQRALAELLHNAELQQQMQSAGRDGAGGAAVGAGAAGGGGKAGSDA